MREGQILCSRFELIRLLGAGDASELWLAEDRELRERVAVRALSPALAASADARARLRDACREGRRLAHANIARTYDYHEDDDRSFVTREYVEGEDLSSRAGRPGAEILALVLPIVDALAHAHARGVSHGDLAASKIIVDESGAPRLVDFASAIVDARPTPADDVYSLGLMLQALLSDETGLAGQPNELAALLSAMLASNPADRPDGMDAVKVGLEPFARPAPAQAPVARVQIEPILPRARTSAAAPGRGAGTGASQAAPRYTQSQIRFTAAAAGVLFAAVITVFFVLPELVPSGREAAPDPADPEPATAPGPQPPARPAARSDPDGGAKLAAERLLGEFLELQSSLEARAVDRWAAGEHESAVGLAAEGDQRLRSGDYAGASERYREAIGILEQVAGRVDQVLAEALAGGRAALELGARPEALERFELALAIDPGNPAAAAGLERARNLDQVLALMRSGRAHEEAGELREARDDYGRARELDPEWAAAGEAQLRVQARIEGQDFERSMAAAVRALAAGDFAESRAQYEAALSLRPDSSAARQGLAQVRQNEMVHEIAVHRRLAQAAEKREQWEDAIRHYEAALKIDAALTFANQGLERSRERERISVAAARLIANPATLYRPSALEQAKSLLVAGARLPERGPVMEEQLAQLAGLVRIAATPISVVLESDELTDVVVHKVGRLGSFLRRELQLRPGTYVVVGVRDGYRDVRHEITVAPGQATPRVVVRCSEQI